VKNAEYQITSHSPGETHALGVLIGKNASPGLLIAMTGELGSGKTRLTQGIARGLEVPEDLHITSPTFALVNEYPGRVSLFHVDLYRIKNMSELEDIGLDDTMVGDQVTVIEWAEKATDILPQERLSIFIRLVDERTRNLLLTGSGQTASNLIEKCVSEFTSQ
jgi:tRNA threonylcarbamoyladenosine biosynthesis protein TsaE